MSPRMRVLRRASAALALAWAAHGAYAQVVLGSGSAGSSALVFLGTAGPNSIALGAASVSGTNSVSMGPASNAGTSAVAIGTMTTAGNNALALGQSANADAGSSAVGPGSTARGGATVIGGGFAQGSNSLAFYTQVYGASSTGLGGGPSSGIWANNALSFGGTVYANEAIALGLGSSARALRSVALGRGNNFDRQDGTVPDPVVAAAGDPILMVANWDAAAGTNQKNALTIYRNNQAHLNGVLRVKPGGDISMGSFTAVPAGVVFP